MNEAEFDMWWEKQPKLDGRDGGLGKLVRLPDGRVGRVLYHYSNGFVLVYADEPINGGILNNDSTYRVEEVKIVDER